MTKGTTPDEAVERVTATVRDRIDGTVELQFHDAQIILAALRASSERTEKLEAALTDALPFLRMLEKFGEDSVWRPAKRHREAFDAALSEKVEQ